jgi:microcin C transport system substrate-binding protein
MTATKRSAINQVNDMRNWALLAIHAFALVCALTLPAERADAAEKRYGLSAFGDLKYPADFKHFDYVNPDAPKGGRLSSTTTSSVLSFDTFNIITLKNDKAFGLDMIYDSLMTRAYDEPDAVYGLVAHSAEVADDKRSVTFYLRPEAKFRDGTPLTAEDVVFTYNTLRDVTYADAHYVSVLRDVTKSEALDAHTVRYEFKGDNLRDLPRAVALLPILSKAYYTKMPVDRASLEPPVGSGPYEIGSFKQGLQITYKRRPDYWGRDLPVNRGRWNFDEIRYEYFRDRTPAMEAFKAGNYDLREEFTSEVWVKQYNDLAQVKSGRVVLLTIPDENPSGAQGFFINTRREKFTDRRVRKALDYAFDFEWMNKYVFFDQYKRTDSYFVNSDLKSEGPPSEAELKLLEPFRDKLPLDVFGPPYVPPVTDGSGQDRQPLTIASRLLDEAGWTVNDKGARVNAKGETLTIELLMDEPGFQKVYAPFVKRLQLLGIDAKIRAVDAAQAQVRLKSFDFDVNMERHVMDPTPGTSIQNYWSSASAKISGSANLAGISNPVVDALVDKMLTAKSRDELRTAARALDRVLRAGHYWVPQWYKSRHNIAFWDRFSWPATRPKYDRGIEDTWWYDEAKAAKLKK